MITIDGISGAWNYTIGPIYIWRGIESLADINLGQKPVVIVGKHIPLPDLGRIDFTRVLGFVLEEGGPGDPSMMIYSNQHRATVLQAAGAIAAAKDGKKVVVDGVNGKVFFEPDEETLDKYTELRKKGPPPEPPGMVEKLMKVATDFKSLDPNALKDEIFDFNQLGAVMDGVMAIWRKESLSGAQRAELKKFAKGKPIEGSMEKNLARYDKWLAERPAEDEGPADVKDDRKGRGRASREVEEAPEGEGDARNARQARGGRSSTAAPGGTAAARASVEAGEPATGAATSEGDKPGAPDSAKDAAASRRAAREAEIEAARKARRGDDKK